MTRLEFILCLETHCAELPVRNKQVDSRTTLVADRENENIRVVLQNSSGSMNILASKPNCDRGGTSMDAQTSHTFHLFVIVNLQHLRH